MANLAKRASKENGPLFLKEALKGVQKQLSVQLERAKAVSHDGKRCDVTETEWIKVFRSYLPNRYAVASGIIIDSEGHTSDQIDVVIYDLQYTPCLLSQEPHQYIPAEAVYAVIEVKPQITAATIKYAGEKAASVRRLKRTSVSITHAGGVYQAKPLFPILAGLVATDVGWKSGYGKEFIKLIFDLKDNNRLDFGCSLTHGAFDLFSSSGLVTSEQPDTGLIFFLFRLLDKLQTLGTVPAIDWNAYARALQMSKE